MRMLDKLADFAENLTQITLGGIFGRGVEIIG
jgi:hypothetical protein